MAVMVVAVMAVMAMGMVTNDRDRDGDGDSDGNRDVMGGRENHNGDGMCILFLSKTGISFQ